MAGVLFGLAVLWGFRGIARPWASPPDRFTDAFPVFLKVATCAFITYVFWPWPHTDDDSFV
jgi:hypothetical protein